MKRIYKKLFLPKIYRNHIEDLQPLVVQGYSLDSAYMLRNMLLLFSLVYLLLLFILKLYLVESHNFLKTFFCWGGGGILGAQLGTTKAFLHGKTRVYTK